LIVSLGRNSGLLFQFGLGQSCFFFGASFFIQALWGLFGLFFFAINLGNCVVGLVSGDWGSFAGQIELQSEPTQPN